VIAGVPVKRTKGDWTIEVDGVLRDDLWFATKGDAERYIAYRLVSPTKEYGMPGSAAATLTLDAVDAIKAGFVPTKRTRLRDTGGIGRGTVPSKDSLSHCRSDARGIGGISAPNVRMGAKSRAIKSRGRKQPITVLQVHVNTDSCKCGCRTGGTNVNR
jgi:hypothetical protein